MNYSEARILVTRTDRLGDVILATPVLKRLREFYPKAQISFLVRPDWIPILQYNLEKEELELIPYDPHEDVKSLTQKLASKSFDVAIVLRDESVVSRAIRRAGIAVRVGPYSTLRSVFSFNRGVLQQRSRCLMHEAEYNLQLLTKIGIPLQGPAKDADALPRAWIHYSIHARSEVDQWLKVNHVLGVKFWCLHPGSSGSSRYLSQGRMLELVFECLARLSLHPGARLVLTGGEHERATLEAIQKAAPEVLLFVGQKLEDLAELYRRADAVIAHGTGPLHLAAAVGARVLAVFPPLFVLSERRWGPLTSKRLTWVPEVKCPEKYKCRGQKCRYYDCMDRFAASQVLDQFERIV